MKNNSGMAYTCHIILPSFAATYSHCMSSLFYSAATHTHPSRHPHYIHIIPNSKQYITKMGSSVCADDQHKFHHSHQLCSIDVPRRCRLSSPPPPDGNGSFSRFLPSGDDTDDDDPYASDHFRMYEFKIRKCNRSRSHDWTDCPFAHPGEKARRRDPRRFRYSGAVCPDFRRAGHCARADGCSFAHGVFECWLHPTRYRTEACKDGRACNRKVCFFAHSARQLRCPPPETPPSENTGREINNCYCCAYCQSPTSALTRTSPPLSPSEYKEAVAELIASLEAMNLSGGSIPLSPGAGRNLNLPWVVGGCEEQPQFVLSPSSGRGYIKFFAGESKLGQGDAGGRNLMEESFGGPDLGWVNDLLTFK